MELHSGGSSAKDADTIVACEIKPLRIIFEILLEQLPKWYIHPSWWYGLTVRERALKICHFCHYSTA